jgi:hypothetical protein
MSAAEAIAVVLPVRRSEWDARTPELESRLEQEAKAAIAREGQLTTELTREIANEAEIRGRLNQDLYGDDFPELVYVRFRGMAIPHTHEDVPA